MFDPALIPTSMIDLAGWWERWSDAAVEKRGGEQIPLAITSEILTRERIAARAMTIVVIVGGAVLVGRRKTSTEAHDQMGRAGS